MTWVAPASGSSAWRTLLPRTAWRSRWAPVSSGADLPLHTTGRRRPVEPARPAVPTTGIRAVSWAALRCRAIRGDWVRLAAAPSCTRKLA
ncbi:hypothetical protein SCANM63S_09856 [Streptomyces canarius]